MTILEVARVLRAAASFESLSRPAAMSTATPSTAGAITQTVCGPWPAGQISKILRVEMTLAPRLDYVDDSAVWQDTVLVATKRATPPSRAHRVKTEVWRRVTGIRRPSPDSDEREGRKGLVGPIVTPTSEPNKSLASGPESPATRMKLMDFTIPAEVLATLDALDEFIETEIKPLEHQDDNIRFFDHRREWARTDWENGGVPRKDWEELLAESPAGGRGRLAATGPASGVWRSPPGPAGRSGSSCGAAPSSTRCCCRSSGR